MSMRTLRSVLSAALLAASCGNGGPPPEDGDAGEDVEEAADAADAEETAEPDDGGPESEVDDGDGDATPEESYCRPCRWDDECNPGDRCLTLQGIEMACAPPCASAEDCTLGAECVPRAAEAFCMPPERGGRGRTCIVTALGSRCPREGCGGRYDTCSDPAGSTSGFCTRRCASDIDCDPGYNRCGDRGDGVHVCLPPLPPPPERCGTNPPATGVGSSCAGGASCGGGADTCLSSVDPRLPYLCGVACDGAAECPAGSACVPLAGPPLRRYCVPDDCTCLARVPGSMLDDALDAVALDRCDLSFTAASLAIFPSELTWDRFRLPWFDDVHREWLRGEAFVRRTAPRLDAGASPRLLLVRAAELQGNPIEDRPFSPSLDPSDPLTEAIAALVERHGGTANRAAIRSALTGVPADLRRALATVVAALDAAAVARNDAIARIAGVPTLPRAYFRDVSGLVLPEVTRLSVTSRRVQDFLIGDFRYARLFQGAADLLAAVEAADLVRFRGATGFTANVDTPIGRIALRDAADTTHGTDEHPGAVLLLVDTGGNDTYRVPAGATASENNPVSLSIDLGGRDLYAYDEAPTPHDVPPRLPSDADGRYPGDGTYGPFSQSTRGRQGSGTLGIGIALDLGPEGDEYRSLRKSQGWAALGVGILHDAGGDDVYLCEAGCQAAAMFGIAILHDAGRGNDRYEGYHAVQGFAYVKGIGLLYDDGGNDTYLAQPDDVLYYNPQDPGRSNSSMAQGMGFGRRADGSDGVFMSGGLGILRDLAGDDDYECAVFCQGSGYWFGMGLLADGDGADEYDARWYVQGGSAHYAVAALWDAAGDDRYNQAARRLNVTLGGGHDFSTAFLLDDGGDDVYGAPNLSMGAGNENGFGMFVDLGGADSYECSSDFGLGNASVDPASGRRTGFLTVGLFLDADGVDAYSRPTTSTVGDDRLWTQRMHPALTSERGAGVDRAAGVTGF
ncbi:MAG: hypothetical protein QME96_08940 [Myxococcota bacterium]|nr:hypothetical protein [Myxococcota bacterium]